MASFIRKVPTASGARAVQIVHKQGREVVGIEHVGSAQDEGQLAVLIEVARARLLPGQDASRSSSRPCGPPRTVAIDTDDHTITAKPQLSENAEQILAKLPPIAG